MLVIFLDVDGVFNSERYALKLEEKHRQLGHTEPARDRLRSLWGGRTARRARARRVDADEQDWIVESGSDDDVAADHGKSAGGTDVESDG